MKTHFVSNANQRAHNSVTAEKPAFWLGYGSILAAALLFTLISIVLN
ncbi:MAG: hypothetical protein AB1540_02800 [Bdellovibrionota bacterium]